MPDTVTAESMLFELSIAAMTAVENDIDPNVFLRILHLENATFDPNAKNPKSTASGLFQITAATANSLGLTDVFDPRANAEAAARLFKSNEAGLRRSLGRDPTPDEMYLAHQQGLPKTLSLLRNPDSKAVDVAGTNEVLNNGGNANMTAAEFTGLWSQKFFGEDAVSLKAEAQAAAPATPLDIKPPVTPSAIQTPQESPAPLSLPQDPVQTASADPILPKTDREKSKEKAKKKAREDEFLALLAAGQSGLNIPARQAKTPEKLNLNRARQLGGLGLKGIA